MKTNEEIAAYFKRLWPLNRSLTGHGNRKTLEILQELADIQIHETPSGTPCFDWEVPPEWNVNEAWIANSQGEKIVDFKVNNLHLLGYSIPFQGELNYDELKEHLYTKPSQPDVIPYLTSYYAERWGFCMSHKQFLSLSQTEKYTVHIDSTLNPNGTMTWGEAVLPGTSNKEIFFSTYICHPSMANDVLSGMLGQALLYNALKNSGPHHFTYRFIWIPETIGSIYYLSKYGDILTEKMLAGFVLTCMADPGKITWKMSRKDSYTDRIIQRVFKQQNIDFIQENFFPGGSDERQYCSPAFDLPVSLIMRSRYEKFAEYHTSADTLDYISIPHFVEVLELYLTVVKEMEKEPVYGSNNPACEPKLGKRGLYPTLGAQEKYPDYIDAMMWILNLADGTYDAPAMAEKSGMDLELIKNIIQNLLKENLIYRM